MQIIDKEHFIELKSADDRGDFSFRVLKDCSQIQLKTDAGEDYIDVDVKTLLAILECLTIALDNRETYKENL